MDSNMILLGVCLILCYGYAFVAGFTDAANAIATSIATRALSPRTAVLMAGVLETGGALTGTAVALMIGKGIVAPELISLHTVAGAILGAITWSLITYRMGIPVSETHGLIGGVVGAAIASTMSMEAIKWSGLTKILIAILASPLLGFFGGMILIKLIYVGCGPFSPTRMTFLFRNLQRFSAAFMAFSHGRNDAQKPMGFIALTLAIYYGWNVKEMTVPLWTILSVGVVAGIGMAYGGWRIIKTLGIKITNLDTEQGFAAESSAAGVLQLASGLGIPVSTTHTITSAITGAGAGKRFTFIRWEVVSHIVLSWILTLPATIILGGIYTSLLKFVL